MVSSPIWTLIGVVVGAILGFVLNFLREYIQEQKQRRKYLRDLLADLEYNKELAEKGEKKWGYHTLAYTDAKGAKYLFDLPEKLRTQIYDSQAIMSKVYGKGEVSAEEIKRLRELLGSIIPEFKKYLEN
jgi:hypothetical protein